MKHLKALYKYREDILAGIAFFALLVVLYFGWIILCAAHGPLV